MSTIQAAVFALVIAVLCLVLPIVAIVLTSRTPKSLKRMQEQNISPLFEKTFQKAESKTENISENNYTTNQSILLNLSEESLANDTERKYLLRYKNISTLIDKEKNILQDCSVLTPCSQDETIGILKLIDEYTEQLRTLESIYPLHDVLKREKAKSITSKKTIEDQFELHYVEGEDPCYEEEAIKRGVSIEQMKVIRKLEWENAELRRLVLKYTVPNITKTVGDYFEMHYKAALNLAQKSLIAHNPEFELLPAMFVICDYSAASCGKDRYDIADEIMPKIAELCENFIPEEFNQRCDLYGKIIRGKDIRGEWLFGNTDSLSNPISKIAGLLGDILVNPACSTNYEYAPIVMHDTFDVMWFSKEIMFPIIDELVQLFKEIYNF